MLHDNHLQHDAVRGVGADGDRRPSVRRDAGVHGRVPRRVRRVRVRRPHVRPVHGRRRLPERDQPGGVLPTVLLRPRRTNPGGRQHLRGRRVRAVRCWVRAASGAAPPAVVRRHNNHDNYDDHDYSNHHFNVKPDNNFYREFKLCILFNADLNHVYHDR